MDEEQVTGDTGAASPSAQPDEWRPTLNAETVRAAFAESEDIDAEPASTATGGETPGEAETAPAAAPGPVPYDRFTEVNERMKAAEEAAAQLNPWAPAIEALAAQGYTPEQIQQHLTQAAQAPPEPAAEATEAPDPEEAFHAHLWDKGIDPYTLQAENPTAYALAQDGWETRQLVERQQSALEAERVGQAEREAAAAREMQVQRWESDVAAARAKYPDLPQLQDDEGVFDLVAAYMARHGQAPNQAQFLTHVGKTAQSIETLRKQTEQRFAAAKAGDSLAPHVGGGSSPPPVTRPNFHSLKPGEQDAAMVAATRAMMAQE